VTIRRTVSFQGGFCSMECILHQLLSGAPKFRVPGRPGD